MRAGYEVFGWHEQRGRHGLQSEEGEFIIKVNGTEN